MPVSLRPPRIKPWVRKNVDVVGRHRVFEVLKAEMILPNGSPCPHPIFTVACPSWCNVLAITPEDEAVLVWQYRHGTDAMSLEMPGGVVDPGEEPVLGARRELAEETGYSIDAIEPLHAIHPNPALMGNRHYSFVGHGARLTGAPKLDPGEECEVALVAVSDLAALIDEGQITHTLCISAIETYLRRGARR